VLGRKSHGRHTTCCIGGSDRGGKQIWRPEAKRMTAAPKLGTCREVAGQGDAERRPVPHVGKADVLWEVTGMCTTRAAGVGVQASRERFAEITSGRSLRPAAGGPSCKDWRASHQHSAPEAQGLAHQAVVVVMEPSRLRAKGLWARNATGQYAGTWVIPGTLRCRTP